MLWTKVALGAVVTKVALVIEVWRRVAGGSGCKYVVSCRNVTIRVGRRVKRWKY